MASRRAAARVRQGEGPSKVVPGARSSTNGTPVFELVNHQSGRGHFQGETKETLLARALSLAMSLHICPERALLGNWNAEYANAEERLESRVRAFERSGAAAGGREGGRDTLKDALSRTGSPGARKSPLVELLAGGRRGEGVRGHAVPMNRESVRALVRADASRYNCTSGGRSLSFTSARAKKRPRRTRDLTENKTSV
jgi:hypothetical protein